MTEQGTITPIIVTPLEAQALGQAAAILERIADRCEALPYHRQTGPLAPAPRAQDCGRLGGIATFAGDALFDVANVASNYGGQVGVIAAFKRGEREWRENNPRDQEPPAPATPLFGHSVKA